MIPPMADQNKPVLCTGCQFSTHWFKNIVCKFFTPKISILLRKSGIISKAFNKRPSFISCRYWKINNSLNPVSRFCL